jgi:hypothetical protein
MASPVVRGIRRVQERAVAQEDAWRQRVDQHAVALDPPTWLLAELGLVPIDPKERSVWRVAAAELDGDRRAYGLDDPGPAKHRLARVELQQFLDVHADQPAQLLGTGWDALDRPAHPSGFLGRLREASLRQPNPAGAPGPAGHRQPRSPGRSALTPTGAAGERHSARLLDRLGREGYVAFHDLAMPVSPANLDHLVVGPAGYSSSTPSSGPARSTRAATGSSATTSTAWTASWQPLASRDPRPRAGRPGRPEA